ncbi:MAG: hypothetical protein PW788_04690 [Micavibrio sp.]|nr:hypothetical protein [Micavibrio sp.]
MKLNDITPEAFVCHTQTCCPAVFETDAGSYVIIGKKLSIEAQALVEGRVGADEFVIEIPKGMLANAK